MKITKQQLLAKLKVLESLDPEAAHAACDEYLLDYIDDVEISNAVQALADSQPWWACG